MAACPIASPTSEAAPLTPIAPIVWRCDSRPHGEPSSGRSLWCSATHPLLAETSDADRHLNIPFGRFRFGPSNHGLDG